jgi:hypothetical protein
MTFAIYNIINSASTLLNQLSAWIVLVGFANNWNPGNNLGLIIIWHAARKTAMGYTGMRFVAGRLAAEAVQFDTLSCFTSWRTISSSASPVMP